ncbi:MAG: outer membrane lipoprotein-sorting protein [Myxococcota bacterium]
MNTSKNYTLCSTNSDRMGLILGLAATFTASVASAAVDPQRLLVSADNIRNPQGDFSVKVSLAEYRSRKLVGSSVLTVYSKLDGSSGQYNNLVGYLSPKREKGKLVLRNGVDLWFYDPSSKASVRISPQARLLGQASSGDVMSTNLASGYKATLVKKEKIKDDQKIIRTCAKLRVVAQRDNLPYDRIDYWVDEETARPLKAQFFTTEGRLLKTAYFRRYKMVLDQERPTETVIIDGLDSNWITVLRTTDFKWQDVPNTWLQRGFLPRFKGSEQ